MHKTRILSVPDPDSLGRFRRPLPTSTGPAFSPLDHWDAAESGPGLDALLTAASHIRNTDIPVGFPTETVYGLGADATRRAAVRGIFSVKGRPSDNPLIVHVCDLDMLRGLLGKTEDEDGGDTAETADLPAIYRPLVERFWPGPLTILLPVASQLASPPAATAAAPKWTLAPEVTAGLSTFGARMPASALARTLIRLADAPLAGPSANASTRPSPTTAQHVVDDLNGRIEVVLDGGACGVGVESTVVDGLCDPPVILRPGGISLAELRTVPGWERVERAYHDVAQGGNYAGKQNQEGQHDQQQQQQQQKPQQQEEQLKPRAPGMKYKHYSPKARVVLYEDWRKTPGQPYAQTDLVQDLESAGTQAAVVGVIRTSTWPPLKGILQTLAVNGNGHGNGKSNGTGDNMNGNSNGTVTYKLATYTLPIPTDEATAKDKAAAPGVTVLELDLGRDLPSIAHGLFSALRDLDARGADVILVEGIDDGGDDMAVAVMNRLRKAASEVR